MTKEEKTRVIAELSETLKKSPNIYVANTGGLTVAQINDLRRACFTAGVELRVVKNTLLRKALDNAEGNYAEIYPTLKELSAVFFVSEDIKGPAKVIKDFRTKSKLDKPQLKSAYVDSSVFVGDESLESLLSLKSKTELIGDIIGLLQSPAKNVIGALQSGGQKLVGILKTLEEKKAE